ANRHLPPEVETSAFKFAYIKPKEKFGVGQFAAQRSRMLQAHRIPHPNPPPLLAQLRRGSTSPQGGGQLVMSVKTLTLEEITCARAEVLLPPLIPRSRIC